MRKWWRKSPGMIALAWSLLAWGCGQQLAAPEERATRFTLPRPDSYSLIYVRYGFEGAGDVDLSSGGLVYVTRDTTTADTKLTAYFGTVLSGPGYPFEGLVAPVAVCLAPSGSLYVADQGDMKIKKYGRWGGAPDSSFQSDSAWVAFGGIAVDSAGNVYVADSERSFIRSYLPDGTSRFFDSDGHVADLAPEGSGWGYVSQPHGIVLDGDGLLVADTGMKRVQKIAVNTPHNGIWVADHFIDKDQAGNTIQTRFNTPVDVAADVDGYIYVADRGNQRIFKLAPDSLSDQPDSYAIVNRDVRDDPGMNPPQQPPAGLRAIAVNNKRVYALDDALGSVIVWELQ